MQPHSSSSIHAERKVLMALNILFSQIESTQPMETVQSLGEVWVFGTAEKRHASLGSPRFCVRGVMSQLGRHACLHVVAVTRCKSSLKASRGGGLVA